MSFSSLSLLRLMATSREGDRRQGILVRQGRSWFELSGSGHEALAALAPLFEPDDLLFPHYRDRALVMGLGVSTFDLALAFFAKAESCSGGRQMSSLFSDAGRGIVSLAVPTASQCPPAAGAAWACQKRGAGVVVCCVGEASTRQGEFFEALCFAVQEALPLVFVVEDNGYGISTPTRKLTPLALGALPTSCVRRVRGYDVGDVFDAGRAAFERARAGEGPTVLWMELDRLSSHTSSDDHRLYRAPEDLAALRDPIALLRDELVARGELSATAWEREQHAIAVQVDSDYERAALGAEPDASAVMAHLFSPRPSAPQAHGLRGRDEWTMASALNATLRDCLQSDERVLLFGQDIADPKGGVFGLTKGLSSEFGARVQNAPLAEATIVGAGIGLALCGFKPVFEIQFTDFFAPGFNQISNQLATMRWRTAGEWTCPLVLLMPCGAYLPGGGIWHSSSNEGYFAHTPGLRVGMPSTPEDAAALLRGALDGDDPTIILLPKRLFRERVTVSANASEERAWGRAAWRRAGEDVTLVAWGNTVGLALEAADVLGEQSVGVEVIDARTFVPFDWDTVRASVAKTGRLVVVQEENRTGSFGQSLVSEIVCEPQAWQTLLAPPQLVSRPDVFVGFHPELEAAVLPSLDDVLVALRRTLAFA